MCTFLWSVDNLYFSVSFKSIFYYHYRFLHWFVFNKMTPGFCPINRNRSVCFIVAQTKHAKSWRQRTLCHVSVQFSDWSYIFLQTFETRLCHQNPKLTNLKIHRTSFCFSLSNQRSKMCSCALSCTHTYTCIIKIFVNVCFTWIL